ncbi:MAG: hypothetical protein AUK47_24835 [Deltaproteobacteria bacterium CG2_30_63_29]|nr:MAG: hypothetical protein AUK47_24835 [Deltaproteobacteria bacterium CG2_30_63_29]PJB46992.1 MAG: hypothetical protein CO108_04720 [Deltaproteobacteria bacterium CG_4_9_14_3_um_filter_63_12]
MRIAYIFDQILPNSGTDTEQVLSTLSALSRQGVDVTLVLPRRPLKLAATAAELREYYQVKGDFKVVRLRSAFPSNRVFEKAGHAVRASWHRELAGFDLLYTRNIPALCTLLAAGHPVVYETYRPWPKQYPALAALFKVALTRPNFVGMVLHSAYARDTYAALGVDPASLEVVHNGYDPARFTPALTTTEARAKLGLPLERTALTYVGRINEGKGMGVVLDMAAATPDLLYLLVGSEGDGTIEQRAAGMENVRVFPWQTFEDVPTYLFAADILLIPPSSIPLEGVGNTVLPMKLFIYLAAGRTILGPRSPDTAELLEHDVNSWLVPPDDTSTIVAQLKALTSNPEQLARLGAAARATGEALTWDARAERIRTFIERRLPSARRGWTSKVLRRFV